MTRTPAELGMQEPTGTELISLGDDAITINARKTAEWIGKLLEGFTQPIAILDNDDLSSAKFRTSGWYYCRLTTTAATVQNRPPGIGDGPFMVRVVTTPFNYVAQTYYGYSGPAAGVFERNTSNAAGTAFIPWDRLTNLPDLDYRAGIAHSVREQAFRDRIGPVHTGGKGAVALRFDHGLANFNSKIRPLLEARNLPYSLALNSRAWSLTENAGVTPAMVNAWVVAGLAEIWNHSAHHNDAVGQSAQDDAVLGGLNELRGQLPAAIIDGYAVPGVGGTNYEGFNGGALATSFGDTTAGRIIMRHHAVSSGSIPGTAQRVLDGRLRQGQAHYTLDAVTLSAAQTQINTAVSNRTGLQLMMHPSLLDTAGNMSTATLTAVLDYIVAKRDAGDLVVLSPYRMTVADSGIASARVTVDNTVGRRAFAWDATNSRPQMIYGDTGLRNITTLATGTTSGNVHIQRNGNMVTLTLQDVSPAASAASSTDLIPPGSLPAGFRPPFTHWMPVPSTPATIPDEFRQLAVSSTGWVPLYGGPKTTDRIRMTITYATSNPWPTTLPGTAVGAPQ